MRRVAAALILLASCDPNEPGQVPTDVALSRMESCEELESYLEDTAVEVLEAQIDARLEKGFLRPPVPADIIAPELVGSAPFQKVVPDRDRVLVLDGGVLRSVGADPLREIASISIAGAPIGVVPSGDRLFVLTRVSEQTRVILLDRESLALIRMIDIAGTPRSSFADQNGLTLVLAGGLIEPPGATEDLALITEDGFFSDRESEIRDRALDDWLESDDLGRDCTAYYYLKNAPVHLDLARIVRLDAVDLRASIQILISRTDLALAGPTALLSAPHRYRVPRPGQTEHSYLFAFDQNGFIAVGGIDGVPQIVSMNGTIDMITAIDRRVTDPINTWGRVMRAHRIDVLEVSGGRLEARASSPLFAEDQPLRASLLLDDSAIVTTSDRIYAFDLLDLETFAASPLSAPIDRLAETRGAVVAASVRGDQLEIAVLDSASLGRARATRFVADLLPGVELGFSVEDGRIAVPEIGSPAPDFPQTPSVAVRLLEVDETGALISPASIELSLLHAESPEAPHLLYGMFAGGRALAVSDAGAAAFDGANLNMQSVLFK